MKKQILLAIMCIFIMCSAAFCETSVSGVDSPNVDKDTKSQYSISGAHAMRHEGKFWEVSAVQLELADDTTLSIYLTVPDGVEAHIVFSGSCEGDAEICLFENPTISGGTAMTEVNAKMNGLLTVSNVMATLTPTVTDNGEIKFVGLIIGGSGPKTAGGSADSRGEHIVYGSRAILGTLINRGGAAKDASMYAGWYEIE